MVAIVTGESDGLRFQHLHKYKHLFIHNWSVSNKPWYF